MVQTTPLHSAVLLWQALRRGETVTPFEQRPLWLSVQAETVGLLVDTHRALLTEGFDMAKLSRLELDLMTWTNASHE